MTKAPHGSWLLLGFNLLLLAGCGSAQAPEARAFAPTTPSAPPPIEPQAPLGPGLVATDCKALEARLRAEWTKEIEAIVDREYEQWKAAPCGEGLAIRDHRRMRLQSRGRGVRGGSYRPGHYGPSSPGQSQGRHTNVQPAGDPSRWTNLQLDGVDELDRIKTDGRYVYVLARRTLTILTAQGPRLVAQIRLDCPRGLFLHGSRLLVMQAASGDCPERCTMGYECRVSYDDSKTRIVVFDVSDPEHPRQLRDVTLSGALLIARRVGSRVHAVVGQAIPAFPPRPDDSYFTGCWLPAREPHARRFAEQVKEAWIAAIPAVMGPTITEGEHTQQLCDEAVIARRSVTLTSVATLDLDHPERPVRSTTILSEPGPVFVTPDRLFLAEPSRGDTNIHHFVLGTHDTATRYVGSGTVKGQVPDQWALDVWEGHLRVVSSGDGNSVTVLRLDDRGPLEPVGVLTRLAVGEHIRATRFDGDRGFVVTFMETDPLFMLDISNPAAPHVHAELELPGFATYIHQLDEDHLLTFGFDAQDMGGGAWFQGMQLQIFDVHDLDHPQLLHQAQIGTRGSSSGALKNHLAFNYDQSRELLALPITLCAGGEANKFGTQMTFSGLLVYHASVQQGFQRLGGIPHETDPERFTCKNWWTRSNSVVQRSLFIDDLVFSIADDVVLVARLADLQHPVARIPLE